jgi:hypothetical protein
LAHWRTLLPTFFEDVFSADPANVLQIGFETVEKTASRRRHLLSFTIAPHLQPINHRGCFSPFAGI